MKSIRRIADVTMTLPYQMWAFGEAIAMDGLLEAGEVTGDTKYQTYVYALLNTTISKALGKKAADHLVPGRALLSLYETTGDSRFLEAARKLVDLHEQLPKTKGGALLVRSDQPGWAYQIWVDSMDIIGPLYARFARVTGEMEWAERGIALMLAYARHLQHHNGLMYHGFDAFGGQNGVLWARGQGWALAGMSDVLACCEPDVNGYAELLERYTYLISALVSVQAQSGLWCTIVDDPSSYEETTLATLFVSCLKRFCPEGLDFQASLIGAEKAVLNEIDSCGFLNRVSSATPVAQATTYQTRPFGHFAWGQGPLLEFMCRRKKDENHQD